MVPVQREGLGLGLKQLAFFSLAILPSTSCLDRGFEETTAWDKLSWIAWCRYLYGSWAYSGTWGPCQPKPREHCNHEPPLNPAGKKRSDDSCLSCNSTQPTLTPLRETGRSKACEDRGLTATGRIFSSVLPPPQAMPRRRGGSARPAVGQTLCDPK